MTQEIIWVVIVGIIAWVLYAVIRRALIADIVVFDYQRGLKYCKGRVVKVLSAGQYRIRRSTTRIVLIDMRQQILPVSGQEVITSDGASLRVSLAGVYEVADPERVMGKVENCQQALYLAMQLAARELIGSSTVDELLEARAGYGPRLFDLTRATAEEMGIKLLSVDIKDIMLSGESKRLFMQIIKARKEGLAALEKARGETAALRSLANAAKLLQDNPALLQLRALQQLGESSGNTLVLGIPEGTTLITKKEKPQKPQEPMEPESDE